MSGVSRSASILLAYMIQLEFFSLPQTIVEPVLTNGLLSNMSTSSVVLEAASSGDLPYDFVKETIKPNCESVSVVLRNGFLEPVVLQIDSTAALMDPDAYAQAAELYQRCLKQLKQARDCVQPNFGFRRALILYADACRMLYMPAT